MWTLAVRSFLVFVIVVAATTPATSRYSKSVLVRRLQAIAEKTPTDGLTEPDDDPAMSAMLTLIDAEVDIQALHLAVVSCYERSHVLSRQCDGYCPVAFRYDMAIDFCIERLARLGTPAGAEALVRLYFNERYNWGAHTREEFYLAICNLGELALPYLERERRTDEIVVALTGAIRRGERCRE